MDYTWEAKVDNRLKYYRERRSYTMTSRLVDYNKIKIIKYIRTHENVTRTRMSKDTRISKVSITRIVNRLEEKGVLIEGSQGESSGGRKPVFIEINSSAGYCISVNITLTMLTASIIDLQMKVMRRETSSLVGLDENEILTQIHNSIEKLLQSNVVDPNKIIGIGLGVPGAVDYNSGVIKKFGEWNNFFDFSLRKYIEDKFNYPVFLENIVNVSALAELWHGYGVGYENMLYILCSEGVGCSIIKNGKVIHGRNNLSYEFGHIPVGMDNRLCRCGRRGCVEAYSSLLSIEKSAKENTPIESFLYGKEITYKKVFEGVERGDEFCKKVVYGAANHLSTAIANIIELFDPQAIMFSGKVISGCGYFYDKTVELINSKLFAFTKKEIDFYKRSDKDSFYEIGVGLLVLNDYFEKI